MDGPQSETIDARKEGFITRVRMNTGLVTVTVAYVLLLVHMDRSSENVVEALEEGFIARIRMNTGWLLHDSRSFIFVKSYVTIKSPWFVPR